MMKRSNEDTRSSQIFFTARVKNKREDTKLKNEMKHLEREFGHTIFSIHKDIRDLKTELKITKRSSGHSSEGWFVDDDDDANPMMNDRSRPTKSAVGERRRNNVLGHRRLQIRVSSAPAAGNSRDISVVHRLTKTPERHVRENDQIVFNCKSGEKQTQNGKAAKTKKHGMKTIATKIVPANQDITINNFPYGDNDKDKQDKDREHENKCIELDEDFAKETEHYQEHSRAGLQVVKRNSFLNPLTKPHSDVQDEMILERNNVQSTKAHMSVSKPDERPLPPMITKFAKERWLKPTLKTKTNEDHDVANKPKKTVRIDSHTSHYQESNASNLSGKILPASSENLIPQNTMKTAAFMTESHSSTANLPPRTNLLKIVSSTIMGNSNVKPDKKPVNVIPDVRKKFLSSDEIKMKRKRDNLLASSVSALLAGKAFGRKSGGGTSQSGNGDESEGKPVSGPDKGKSPSPKQRRRFSFGTITMLAMNQHKAFPLEKKATLGSRLKLKTPAEESEQRNIDIRKSVLVNDSDSDDDGKKDYAVPAKPVSDLKNVKSKISNQWNQDAVLEKPPTLVDDTFQLQRSLAAAHISRGRDLREMQDGNEIDPMKIIDDDRKSALMMKLKAFNKLVSVGDKQESRRKSVMDAIHAGTDGKQILKLMRLANQN